MPARSSAFRVAASVSMSPVTVGDVWICCSTRRAPVVTAGDAVADVSTRSAASDAPSETSASMATCGTTGSALAVSGSIAPAASDAPSRLSPVMA